MPRGGQYSRAADTRPARTDEGRRTPLPRCWTADIERDHASPGCMRGRKVRPALRREIDFVMNVFAAWTGVRRGELLAIEGGNPRDKPLSLVHDGISTYALD